MALSGPALNGARKGHARIARHVDNLIVPFHIPLRLVLSLSNVCDRHHTRLDVAGGYTGYHRRTCKPFTANRDRHMTTAVASILPLPHLQHANACGVVGKGTYQSTSYFRAFTRTTHPTIWDHTALFSATSQSHRYRPRIDHTKPAAPPLCPPTTPTFHPKHVLSIACHPTLQPFTCEQTRFYAHAGRPSPPLCTPPNTINMTAQSPQVHSPTSHVERPKGAIVFYPPLRHIFS